MQLQQIQAETQLTKLHKLHKNKININKQNKNAESSAKGVNNMGPHTWTYVPHSYIMQSTARLLTKYLFYEAYLSSPCQTDKH